MHALPYPPTPFLSPIIFHTRPKHFYMHCPCSILMRHVSNACPCPPHLVSACNEVIDADGEVLGLFKPGAVAPVTWRLYGSYMAVGRWVARWQWCAGSKVRMGHKRLDVFFKSAATPPPPLCVHTCILGAQAYPPPLACTPLPLAYIHGYYSAWRPNVW